MEWSRNVNSNMRQAAMKDYTTSSEVRQVDSLCVFVIIFVLCVHFGISCIITGVVIFFVTVQTVIRISSLVSTNSILWRISHRRE